MEPELKKITPELLSGQIDDYFTSKIKNYRQSGNRASNLGACTRYLVYKRTQPEMEALHDLGLQKIFDEGNAQEKYIKLLFMDIGYNVTKGQREIDHHPDFKAANITGSTDLELSREGFKPVLIEVKSMSPNIFPYILTIEDLDKYPWTRKYYAQMQLYLHGTGLKVCLLFIKCKSTNKHRVLEVNYDPAEIERLIEKAIDIEIHIANKTIPGRTVKTDECNICNFNHICLPDQHFSGTELLDEFEDIQDMLSEMEKLKPSCKEYDKLNERKKLYCKLLKPDVDRVLMPKFELYKSGRGWKFRSRENVKKSNEQN